MNTKEAQMVRSAAQRCLGYSQPRTENEEVIVLQANKITAMELLLEFAIDEIRTTTDELESCHMLPISKTIDEPEVEAIINANREWIRKAEAAIK